MAVVYGRKIDGKEVTFGTTGYTMNNIFVLYDRDTDSVWYPLSDHAMDAVSGPHRGKKIPFITEPKRMSLKKWRKKHPKTKVLLPPSFTRPPGAPNNTGAH